MSIRRQMAFLLIALSTVLLSTTWAMQMLVMAPAFSKLEREAAEKNVERCVDAIQSDIDNLSGLANDWGAWDDTWRFVQGMNPSFRESNLMEQTFTNTNTEFLCILDKTGSIVWADCFDSASATRLESTELLNFVKSEESGLTGFENNDSFVGGLILTRHGPMMIASRPVIPTSREGAIMGTMVAGRFLNRERVRELSARTHLQLEIWAADAPGLPQSVHSLLDRVGNSATGVKEITEQNEDTLEAVTLMPDLHGRPAIALQILMPREISRHGRKAANAAMLCSLTGVLAMTLGTGIALRMRVVEPLQKFAAHAARVGEKDDLNARLRLTRNDEIGTLARSFDQMVERLAESREKLQMSAHRSGMAEIASEVLHNVGNAINTANCCAELIEERLNSSRVSGFEKATTLLSEQAPRAAEFFTQDPRGPRLINYLATLNETLQQERSENLIEVRRLRETIRHIRDTIASQQEYARHSDFRQRVDLAELLEETILLNSPLQREVGVEVRIEAESLPEVCINRSRVAQVLVNIQKNAMLSMQSQGGDHHVMTISVNFDSEGSLYVAVSDTGEGFTPETGVRLFAQGFTTRRNGTGVGLHYCANVIREMGGEICAESAGPGLGAVFRLRIPRALRRSPNALSTELQSTELQSACADVSGRLLKSDCCQREELLV